MDGAIPGFMMFPCRRDISVVSLPLAESILFNPFYPVARHFRPLITFFHCDANGDGLADGLCAIDITTGHLRGTVHDFISDAVLSDAAALLMRKCVTDRRLGNPIGGSLSGLGTYRALLSYARIKDCYSKIYLSFSSQFPSPSGQSFSWTRYQHSSPISSSSKYNFVYRTLQTHLPNLPPIPCLLY